MLSVGFSAWRRGGTRAADRGAVAVWVADRDASLLVGLDRRLFVGLRVSLAHPLRVVALADGGAWVVCAPAGHPRAAQRLVRVDARGRTLKSCAIGMVLDLAADEAGGVWRIEELDGGRRLCHATHGGERSQRAFAGATAVAARAGACLVGTEGGRVELASGTRQEVRALGAGVVDLAAAGATDWWVLLENGRLFLLDARLATEREHVLAGARHLSAPAGEDHVFASGAEQVWRIGPRGVTRMGLSARGPACGGRCAATAEGGVLVALPGAVLRLDRRQRLASGQGGFDFAVDLAAR